MLGDEMEGRPDETGQTVAGIVVLGSHVRILGGEVLQEVGDELLHHRVFRIEVVVQAS